MPSPRLRAPAVGAALAHPHRRHYSAALLNATLFVCILYNVLVVPAEVAFLFATRTALRSSAHQVLTALNHLTDCFLWAYMAGAFWSASQAPSIRALSVLAKQVRKESHAYQGSAASLFAGAYQRVTLLHVLASLPLDLCLVLFTSDSDGMFPYPLAVLRLPRLLWVFDLPMHRLPSASATVRRSGKLLLWMLLAVHLAACGFYFLHEYELFYHDAVTDTWLPTEYYDWSALELYGVSLYWSVITMVTAGLGDLVPQTSTEVAYVVGVIFAGIMLTVAVVGHLTGLLASAHSATAAYQRYLSQVRSYMEHRDLPATLRRNILSYYDYMWARFRGVNTERELLQKLPLHLRSKLVHSTTRGMLAQVPLFRPLPPVFLEAMAASMKTLVYAPGDALIQRDHVRRCLFIMRRGTAVIPRTGQQLTEGEVFNDLSLVIDQPARDSVTAHSYCEVYTLSREVFNHLLDSTDLVSREQVLELTKTARRCSAMADMGTFASSLCLDRIVDEEEEEEEEQGDSLQQTTFESFAHPDAPMRRLYERAVPVFGLLAAILLPLATVVPNMAYYTYFVDAFFLVDTVLRLSGRLLYRREDATLGRYSASQLRWQLVGLLPLELIEVGLHGLRADSEVIALLRFNRLALVALFLQHFRRVAQLMFLLVLSTHWVGCIWLWLGMFEEDTGRDSWLAHDATTIEQSALGWRYVRSVYFVLVAVTTLGYGDIVPVTTTEMGLATAFVFVGGLAYPAVLGAVATLLVNLDASYNSFRDNLRTLSDFQALYNVPELLSAQIRGFYEHFWAQQKAVSELTVLSDLPVPLRLHVLEHITSDAFAHMPFLNDVPKPFVSLLMSVLRPRLFAPGDVLIQAGEQLNELFILKSGTVDVSDFRGQFIVQLHGPQVLGETALLGHKEKRRGKLVRRGHDLLSPPAAAARDFDVLEEAIRARVASATVCTVDYCDVFALHRTDFAWACSQFPGVRSSIEQSLVQMLMKRFGKRSPSNSRSHSHEEEEEEEEEEEPPSPEPEPVKTGKSRRTSLRVTITPREDDIAKSKRGSLPNLLDSSHLRPPMFPSPPPSPTIIEEVSPVPVSAAPWYARALITVFSPLLSGPALASESRFRRRWVLATLALLMYSLLVIPFRIVFLPTWEAEWSGALVAWFVFDVFTDLFWWADMYLQGQRFSFWLHAFHIEDPEAILDRTLPRLRVLLIASLPYDLVAAPFVFGLVESSRYQLLALSLCRVPRLLHFVTILEIDRTVLHSNRLRLVKLFVSVVVFAHVMACAFFSIAVFAPRPNKTWLNVQVENGLLSSVYDEMRSSYYIRSLNWALPTSVVVVIGDVVPGTAGETLFVLLAIFVGICVNGAVIGSITDMISQFDPSRAKHRREVNAVNERLARDKIPRRIRRRIHNFFDFRWHETRAGFAEDVVLSQMSLPRSFKALLHVHLKLPYLQSQPCFQTFDAQHVGLLAMWSRFELHCPGDYVVHEGELATNMFYVVSGALEAFPGPPRDRRRQPTYRRVLPGANFGETASFRGTTCSTSVRALKYSRLVVLPFQAVRRLVVSQGFDSHVDLSRCESLLDVAVAIDTVKNTWRKSIITKLNSGVAQASPGPSPLGATAYRSQTFETVIRSRQSVTFQPHQRLAMLADDDLTPAAARQQRREAYMHRTKGVRSLRTHGKMRSAGAASRVTVSQGSTAWALVATASVLCTVYAIVATPMRLAFLSGWNSASWLYEMSPGVQDQVLRSFAAEYVVDVLGALLLFVRRRRVARRDLAEFNRIVTDPAELWQMSKRRVGAFVFYADLVAAFPYELLFLLFGLPAVGVNDKVAVLQGLALCRIPKMLLAPSAVRLCMLWSRVVTTQVGFLRGRASELSLVLLFALLCMLSHLFSCMWTLVVITAEHNVERTWVSVHGFGDASPSELWLRGVYFSLVTMTTVGYGDIKPVTDTETVLQLVVVVTGAFVFAMLVGMFSSLFYPPGAASIASKLKEARALLNQRKGCVSPALQGEILDRYASEMHFENERREFYSVLPPYLAAEAALAANRFFIDKVRVLHLLDSTMLAHLVSKFMRRLVSPGHYIFKHGALSDHTRDGQHYHQSLDESDEVYFVDTGVALLVDWEQKTHRTYGEGEAFGYSQLFLRGIVEPSVVAQSLCEVVVLQRSHLRELGEVMPAFKETELYKMSRRVRPYQGARKAGIVVEEEEGEEGEEGDSSDSDGLGSGGLLQRAQSIEFMVERREVVGPTVRFDEAAVRYAERQRAGRMVQSRTTVDVRRRGAAFPMRKSRTDPEMLKGSTSLLDFADVVTDDEAE